VVTVDVFARVDVHPNILLGYGKPGANCLADSIPCEMKPRIIAHHVMAITPSHSQWLPSPPNMLRTPHNGQLTGMASLAWLGHAGRNSVVA
jgi:hypothetical protein